MQIFKPAYRWLIVASVLAVLGISTSAGALHAQAAFDGKYRCVRIEVGKETGQCQSPPLILSQDGSYEIWGEHGTYKVVQDRWLVLSHSKRRGPGHFVGPDEIVFEYKIGSTTCRVTFRQVYDPPPGYDAS
jgi:hypothetical protein